MRVDRAGRTALAVVRLAAVVGLAVVAVRARVLLARRDAQLRRLQDELGTLRREGAALTGQLRAEARTDPLTGLANLRQWQEQVHRELERARRSDAPLAVALVDLDRFKLVNDTRGHAAGDALLRDVSAGFLGAVRTVDLVARIGGEEFAVALPDVSLEDAVIIMERLRASLPPGHTCSAGLALWDGEEAPEALQSRADVALYRAKASGRDRLVLA